MKKNSKKKINALREYLLVCLLLFGLISLMLWRIVWWGWVLYAGDTWTLYYPAKAYVAALIGQGKFPLWTPNIFFGFPLFAEAQVAALYPLHIVYLIFSTPVAFNLSIIIRLMAAGIFTYLYVRRITQDKWAAVSSAVTFAFSGYIMAQLRHENVEHALIWLPVILYALDRWILERNRRMLALAMTCMGISFLAGYFFISLLVLITAVAYYIWLYLQERRKEKIGPGVLWRLVSGLSVFGVLGVGLAGVQVLPGYELSQESIRAGGFGYQESTQVSFSPLHLICFLIPKFFGYPMDHTVWGLWRANAIDLVCYLGILPFMLIIGALLIRRDRYTLFFGLLFIGALIIAFGQFSPIWRLLNMLPVFSMMRNPSRLLALIIFSGSILAGLGFHTLLYQTDAAQSRLKRFRRIVMYGAGVFIVACMVSGPLISSMRTPLTSFGRWFVDRFVYEQSIHQEKRDHYYTLIEQNYDQLVSFAYLTHPYIYMPVLFVLGSSAFIFYITRRPRNHQVAGLIAVCFISGDLIYFGHAYNWFLPPKAYDQKQYYIEVMEKDPGVFRYSFAPLTDNMQNYDALVYDQMYIQGYSPIQMKRHADLTALLRSQMAELPDLPSSPLMDMLNIKYVVTGDSLAQDWAAIRFNEGARVYENKAVFPRAFVVPHARFVSTPEEALSALADSSFNPRKWVVLETDRETAEPIIPRVNTVEPQSSVDIQHYDIDEIIIEVNAHGGYLVLTDSYYPGWHVEVDAQEQRIVRANYLFRAVHLTPGRHQVRFYYAPLSFKIGGMISLLSLAGIIGVCIGRSSKKTT